MLEISSEILLKATNGDWAAFEQIYKTTVGFVYNVAFRVVNNKQEAEEVSQEVFLTIYHKLKTFRLESSFKTWVYRITVNCAINHYRKISKEHNQRVEYNESLVEDKTPQETVGNQEAQQDLVSALLETLNPDQKACVILRSIEGLSYQEIADVLKININTVRSRLKRARETLINSRKEVIKDEM